MSKPAIEQHGESASIVGNKWKSFTFAQVIKSTCFWNQLGTGQGTTDFAPGLFFGK
jgi:hypothetical protein